jgi:hypothetical protein
MSSGVLRYERLDTRFGLSHGQTNDGSHTSATTQVSP